LHHVGGESQTAPGGFASLRYAAAPVRSADRALAAKGKKDAQWFGKRFAGQSRCRGNQPQNHSASSLRVEGTVGAEYFTNA
jgi:hypothetical protein